MAAGLRLYLTIKAEMWRGMKVKDELYQCTKCLSFQPKENFHKKKNKLGIRSVCKNCRGVERTKVYAENKDQELENCKLYRQNNPEKRKECAKKFAAKNYIWFRNFLNEIKNVHCFDCKKLFPPCAMDFDHRDPSTKLFSISEMGSRGKPAIVEEISKCDIVCANCHRIRGYNRNHTKLSKLNIFIYPYKNKGCMDCGIAFPPYAMDFDHRNPKEKLFDMSKPFTRDENIILAEINKCDIVCANCHRIRTFVNVEAA